MTPTDGMIHPGSYFDSRGAELVSRSTETNYKSEAGSGNGPAASGTYRAQHKTLTDEDPRLSYSPFAPTEKDRFLLTVLKGPDEGAVFRLDREVLTIGRSERADLTIADPSLSRVHAKLVLADRGDATSYLLEDCNSTNGTFVAGESVTRPTLLQDGSRIGLGKRSVLKFSAHDALEEQATLDVHASALRDGLTQLYNRRVFEDRLRSEFAFATRHGRPLSVILLDIDHFKKINDTWGHPAGDHVLRLAAGQLASALRVEDMIARYGGEEFVVVSRDAFPTEAMVIAERLRAIVEHTPMSWQGDALPVTASVGVACNYPSAESPETLVSRADSALYSAKKEGRNRVVVYGVEGPSL